jgi:hypothetical protein
MKIIRSFFLIITFILCAVNLSAENKISTDPELHKIALEMKSAVLNMDMAYLINHVAPSGTYFIDTGYSHDQIERLVRDKNSWLYKYLFVDKNSVKNYFKQARDLKIKVFKRDINSIMISYQSSNFEAHKWIENCLIKINGKWYFDGIFTCL